MAFEVDEGLTPMSGCRSSIIQLGNFKPLVLVKIDSAKHHNYRIDVKKKLHWLLPAVFTFWMACAFFVLSGSSGFDSVWLTNVFSLSLVPLWFITFLLKPIGLTMSDTAYSGPTDLGFVIGTLFYDLLLFGLGRLIQIKYKKKS